MNDKYVSRDNLELVIDGLKVGMTSDWNENDKNEFGYIRNKPFYTEYGAIVDNYSGEFPRPKCIFDLGEKYDVIWNGTRYNGLVCHDPYGDYNARAIGGDGYPFYIETVIGGGFYVEPESGYTVSVLGDIVHQLDEKYIPDSVARVEDVTSLGEDVVSLGEDVVSLRGDIASLDGDTDRLNVKLSTLEKEAMIYGTNDLKMPLSGRWNAMAYGNGVFVAFADNGTNLTNVAAYSIDGINWIKIELPISSEWNSVVYGNGRFVAVPWSRDGTGNTIIYSEDGIKWIMSTLPYSTSWMYAAYGNGMFVVTSSLDNKVAYSTDCITWSSTTLPFNTANGIVYGDDKFVVIRGMNSNNAAYSTDGINWIATTLPNTAINIKLIYGNGKFMTTFSGKDGNGMFYSTDGISWSYRDAPYTSRYQCPALIYGGGKFVIVYYTMNSSDISNKVSYSTDGITWTETTLPMSMYLLYASTYGDGKFIIVDCNSGLLVYSTDGINWYNTYDAIYQNNEDRTGDIRNLLLDGHTIPAPSTAQVGQTIVVKSVDGNGKPTEWEAVDAWTISSSTEGSTKKFKLTIDDSGVLTATEITV